MDLTNLISTIYYLRCIVLHEFHVGIDILFTLVFICDMLGNCITEVDDSDGAHAAQKSLGASIKKYLCGLFWFDLVTVVPFHQILISKVSNSEYFLLLKTLRLMKIQSEFMSKRMIRLLRTCIKLKTSRQALTTSESDKLVKLQNNTYIVQLVYSHQVFKILESYLELILLSFSIGVVWYVVHQIEDLIWPDLDLEIKTMFQNFEGVEGNDRTIMITYFITTTLATVGFGDFAPKSNQERIVGILVMLGGVATFSFIFSKATSSLDRISKYLDPFEDSRKQLLLFFAVLRRFNGNQPFCGKIRTEIEDFFEFMWNNDPTQALRSETDRLLFEQLPHSVRQRIYTQYLFDDFLEHFKALFNFEKPLKSSK